MKCAKCNNLCYLRCFGIEKSENINEKFEIVSIKVAENGVMYAIMPCTVFVCCEPLRPDELKTKLKIPAANRGNSKTRQTKTTETNSNVDNSAVLSDSSEIKSMISKLQSKTDGIHEDTQCIVSKSIESNITGQKKIVLHAIFLWPTHRKHRSHTGQHHMPMLYVIIHRQNPPNVHAPKSHRNQMFLQ